MEERPGLVANAMTCSSPFHSLRSLYLRGMFRWSPSTYSFDTVGEAETFEFLASLDNEAALAAACALEGPWSDEASAWLGEVERMELQVALEQCCHSGRLMPVELRALRLQRFPHGIQVQCESAIRQLTSGSAPALVLVYWWVRIERAQRTGSPDLDSVRPTVLVIDEKARGGWYWAKVDGPGQP
jgi:hypothetical protein